MPHLFVIAKYPMTIPPAHHSNVYDSLAIVVKKITTMFPPPPGPPLPGLLCPELHICLLWLPCTSLSLRW